MCMHTCMCTYMIVDWCVGVSAQALGVSRLGQLLSWIFLIPKWKIGTSWLHVHVHVHEHVHVHVHAHVHVHEHVHAHDRVLVCWCVGSCIGCESAHVSVVMEFWIELMNWSLVITCTCTCACTCTCTCTCSQCRLTEFCNTFDDSCNTTAWPLSRMISNTCF